MIIGFFLNKTKKRKGGILCCSWNGERESCGELCICLLLREEIHELRLIGVETTSCQARPGQSVLHELFYLYCALHLIILFFMPTN